MIELLLNWALFAGIFGLVLLSPGPDFVVAVRNSIMHSRFTGLMTAVGFGLGVMVHCAYTLAGIATIISQSVILFNIIKLMGAAYLIYIGIQALRSKGHKEVTIDTGKIPQKPMSAHSALLNGFLTNVLNPKATIFFLAVFSQFINGDTSLGTQITYLVTCFTMTALWFSMVAIFLTIPKVRYAFLNFAHWIDRICGGMLIALGLKLALTRASN